MTGLEKSDLPIVAGKPANNATDVAAEPVERRGGTKENARARATVRTQSRAAVSQAQARIREAITRNRKEKLTALLHHISIDVLHAAFLDLKTDAAPGIDGLTWARYAETLEANLADLHARIHRERIGRCHRDGCTSRSRMAGNGRSALPQWRTRSSRRRWWRS